MIRAQDISKFTERLHKTSIEEDKSFLLSLGRFLRTARREELSNRGAVVYYIEQFFDEFNEKKIGRNSDFSDDIEDTFIEMRAMAMDLAERTEKGKFDAPFYAQVQNLGKKLIEFSNFLKP